MWVNPNRLLSKLRPIWHASFLNDQHTNNKKKHVCEFYLTITILVWQFFHFFDDLDRRIMRPLTLLLVAYPSPLQLTVSLLILFASFSSLWWRLTEPLLFSSLPFSSRPMQDLVPRLFLFSSLSLRLTQVLDLNNLKPAGTFLLLLLLEPSPPSQGEKVTASRRAVESGASSSYMFDLSMTH